MNQKIIYPNERTKINKKEVETVRKRTKEISQKREKRKRLAKRAKWHAWRTN